MASGADDMTTQVNPYEALDLDASLDVRELTAELRDRAEQLLPSERASLQAHWQAITLSPKERARYALTARPRQRQPAQLQAALRQVKPPHAMPAPSAAELLAQLEPLDLVLLPPLGLRESDERGSELVELEQSLDTEPYFAVADSSEAATQRASAGSPRHQG